MVQNWLVHLCTFPWRHPGNPLPLGKPAPTSRHPPPLFYPRKLSLTSQIYFPSLQERRGAHFIRHKSRVHITHDALELGCMRPNHGSGGETHWRAGWGGDCFATRSCLLICDGLQHEPLGSEQTLPRIDPPTHTHHVLHLPFICRKTLVKTLIREVKKYKRKK